ncbi:cyclic nucleotide-binding-like protein [Panaeolus papilionaceus]|nr:cyclic nucleotide-binding-like protein [Panaeolus papilionaceus]
MSSTFDALIVDLTRDYQRVQPKDSLQYCANWFQSRLEEQRARTRDLLSSRPGSLSVPSDLFTDTQLEGGLTPTISPFARPRPSIAPSPFGTLNVPGNALLGGDRTPPSLRYGQRELPPTSPLTTTTLSNPFASFDTPTPIPMNSGDFLHPPNSAIFARRTSVSAESIAVDSANDEPLPYYPKTDDQIRRIKAAIGDNFIFRDLDEEQERGVLNAIQEHHVVKGEVVIRQGDVGEYFYVVESGLLYCFIRSDPLPPTWLSMGTIANNITITEGKGGKQNNEFGKLVQECKPGSSFGELALMYGHPRAASVVAIEESTLWSLDRITFRTIILKAAHRRRTMYERFLSTVELLSSLDAPERSKIADALVSKVYADGEAVVTEGEMGDTFFFVEEGEAIVTKRVQSNGETRNMRVSVLRQGDYFGGTAFLFHFTCRIAY